MDDEQVRRRRFVRGMLLAWIPILIVIASILVGVISRLRLAEQKAVGLGAVAGGFGEAFATFGLIAFFAAEIFGVVLLSRSLSKGRPARSFFATISICIGALMVLFEIAGLWFLIYASHLGHS
jgi:hypothetical protein